MKKLFRLTLVVLAVLGLFFGLMPVLAADNVDMTGTWNIIFKAKAGSTNAGLVLKQEGDALSGTCREAGSDTQITGKVTGNHFVIDEFESMWGKISLKGTVEGDTCKGNMLSPNIKDGTFEGTKEK